MFRQLREDIASIFERDPAARTTIEVLTCYPGLHAVYVHKLARWFWTHGLRWLGRFTSHVGRWATGIEIHPGAIVGRRVFIDHGMGVVIGETANVGDDCTIYQGVTLGGTSLYRGAKVLGGFTVGAGAKIGSNAVVVKEVPAGATVVGIPGRVIEEAPAHKDARFAAYAVEQNQDDPYAQEIQKLAEHSAELEQALAKLKEKLAELEKDERREQLRAVK